jgi:hypothetical protein
MLVIIASPKMTKIIDFLVPVATLHRSISMSHTEIQTRQAQMVRS